MIHIRADLLEARSGEAAVKQALEGMIGVRKVEGCVEAISGSNHDEGRMCEGS